MSNYKTSIYFHAFNLTAYPFSYKEAVDNFTKFADEVVCATFVCKDNSHLLLKELEKQYSNFKVIVSDVTTDDVRFDGKLKTIALQNTTNPVKIIADCDEYFPLSNKEKWEPFIALLMETPDIDGLFIPSLDCWGQKTHIRIKENIGFKFRIHKDTVKERGVIKNAENGDGTWKTDMSDSTEPLNSQGELANFAHVVPPMLYTPLHCPQLINYPYVLHYGYVDAKARAKLNKDFWAKQWALRAGKEVCISVDEKELDNQPTIEHTLPLI